MENSTELSFIDISMNDSKTVTNYQNKHVHNATSDVFNWIDNVTKSVSGYAENVTWGITNDMGTVYDVNIKSATTLIDSNVSTYTFPVIMAIGCIGNALSLVTVLSRHCKKSFF